MYQKVLQFLECQLSIDLVVNNLNLCFLFLPFVYKDYNILYSMNDSSNLGIEVVIRCGTTTYMFDID